MNAITGIIAALGLDMTLFYQLGLFALAFFFLKGVVFDPYFKAFEERQNRTLGNQELADKLIEQAKQVEVEYQNKARALNSEIKSVYDKAQLEATVEQERIQGAARDKAKNAIDSAREVLQGEFNKAREDLIKSSPGLGQNIAEKLISREVQP